jgi:Flp pilus assembly protein TadG
MWDISKLSLPISIPFLPALHPAALYFIGSKKPDASGAGGNENRNSMKTRLHCGLVTLGQHLRADNTASQLAEFAVSLPLLVVFVVGIFDFGGAFTVKQKLANAAREGARAAAAGPASDVGRSSAAPVSVNDAVQVVDNYLLGENINDCGLNGSSGLGASLTWTYHVTITGPPVCDLKLIINRGCTTQKNTAEGTVYVVDTCVTIEYAYNWRFNNVIGLLRGSLTLPSKLTTTAVAFNEN